MKKNLLSFKKIYNHYLDERTDVIKNTQFKGDVFGDFVTMDTFSAEQIT